MSGPKASFMSIEEMRAAQLNAQRVRNETIVKEALDQVRRSFGDAELRAARLGTVGVQPARQVRNMLSRTETLFAHMAADRFPDDPGDAALFNDRLKTALDREIRKCDDWLGAVVNGFSYLEEDNERGRMRDNSLGAFKDSFDVKRTSSSETLLNGADAMLERLQSLCAGQEKIGPIAETLDHAAEHRARIVGLVMSDALPVAQRDVLMRYVEELRSAVEAYAAHPELLGDLRNRLNMGDIIIPGACEQAGRIAALYDECAIYKARCDELGACVSDLPEIGLVADAGALGARRAEYRKAAKEAADRAYIAHALDAVMKRHGYAVKRAVCLAGVDSSCAGEQMGARSLFIDADAGTGVHVLASANGMVMMEMASVDAGVSKGDDGLVVDRIRPQQAWERRHLVDEQRQFCNVFSELADELAEYGICVQRRLDSPACEENSVAFVAHGSVTTAEAGGQRQQRRRSAGHLGDVTVEREMR